MRASIRSNFVKLVLLFIGLSFNAAQAVVINFDDLEYVIAEDGDADMWYEHPVTDAYLSKGLMIYSGYLGQYPEDRPEYTPVIISSPNFLVGGDRFTLSFVNIFPTYVAMNVVSGAVEGDAVLFDIYSASGAVTHARTTGDAHLPDDPPFIPGELMSFNVPEGIASIMLIGSYQRRVVGSIDDLTYEYASVPEPSTLILLGIGFLSIALRRRITK